MSHEFANVQSFFNCLVNRQYLGFSSGQGHKTLYPAGQADQSVAKSVHVAISRTTCAYKALGIPLQRGEVARARGKE